MNTSHKNISALIYQIYTVRAYAEIRISNQDRVIVCMPNEIQKKFEKIGIKDTDYSHCFSLKKQKLPDNITTNNPFAYVMFFMSTLCPIPPGLHIYIKLYWANSPKKHVEITFDFSEQKEDEEENTKQFCETMINRCGFLKQIQNNEKEKSITMNILI